MVGERGGGDEADGSFDKLSNATYERGREVEGLEEMGASDKGARGPVVEEIRIVGSSPDSGVGIGSKTNEPSGRVGIPPEFRSR